MTRNRHRQPPHTRQVAFPGRPSLQNRLDAVQTELEAACVPPIRLPDLDISKIWAALDELSDEMDKMDPKSRPNRRLTVLPGGEMDHEDANSPLILFHLNEKTGEWEREVLKSPFRARIRQKLRQRETTEATVKWIKRPLFWLGVLLDVLVGRREQEYDKGRSPMPKRPAVVHFYGRTARGDKLHIMAGSATRSTFVCGATPGGAVSASVVPAVEGDICKNCQLTVKRGAR